MDVSAWAQVLGADLRVVEGRAALVPTNGRETASIWAHSPATAFEVVVALIVAGVDCTGIYAHEGRVPKDAHPLYRCLSSGRTRLPLERSSCPPGFELPFALLTVLRNSSVSEPCQLNDILFWVRKALLEFADQPAQRFGDILIQVSLHCAALLDHAGPSCQPGSHAFAQQAVIFLEYTARGDALDEV